MFHRRYRHPTLIIIFINLCNILYTYCVGWIGSESNAAAQTGSGEGTNTLRQIDSAPPAETMVEDTTTQKINQGNNLFTLHYV